MKPKIQSARFNAPAKQFKNQNIKSIGKKLLFFMAIVGALLASCNQKKTEEQEHDHSDGIHQHADGAEHDKHESDTLSQEEFTISKDSSAVKETNKHQHQNGEKHNH